MARLLVAARPGRPAGTAGPPERLLLSEQLHDHQQTDAPQMTDAD